MRIELATVCCRFGSWGLVTKLNFCSDFERFGQDFEVEAQARFKADIWSVFCWCLVEVTKLNHNQDSETKLGQDFKFSQGTVCYCLFEILELMLSQDSKNWNLIKMCARTCDKNSTLGSVVPLAMFAVCVKNGISAAEISQEADHANHCIGNGVGMACHYC